MVLPAYLALNPLNTSATTLLKILLTAALVVLGSACLPAQMQNPTPETVAADTVTELAARRFADVELRLDDTMRSAPPEEKVSAIWDSVQEQAGPFRRIVKTGLIEQQGYQVVFVTCEFQNATLDVKLALNAKTRSRECSLYRPKDRRRPQLRRWSLPPYAKRDAFHETDVTIKAEAGSCRARSRFPTAKGRLLRWCWCMAPAREIRMRR